jgi:hypothetical protein
MSLSKKDKFVMFVYLGAIARDLSNNTTESQVITNYAYRIPEERIPLNPANAAKVFLAYWSGTCKQPHRWMCDIEPKPTRPRC